MHQIPCKHILKFIKKSLKIRPRSTKLVPRSVPNAILEAAWFKELHFGPLSSEQLMKIREEGEVKPYSLILSTDSCSVFRAVQATDVKIPTEKSTLYHVQWIHECLLRKVLKTMFWIDTRDMCADGLTKGSVPRDALRNLASAGKWVLTQAWKQFGR